MRPTPLDSLERAANPHSPSEAELTDLDKKFIQQIWPLFDPDHPDQVAAVKEADSLYLPTPGFLLDKAGGWLIRFDRGDSVRELATMAVEVEEMSVASGEHPSLAKIATNMNLACIDKAIRIYRPDRAQEVDDFLGEIGYSDRAVDKPAHHLHSFRWCSVKKANILPGPDGVCPACGKRIGS